MASTDNKRRLIEFLEQSARNGDGAELTNPMVRLVLDALVRRAEGQFPESTGPDLVFRIESVGAKGRRILGFAAEHRIAKAIFDAAVAANPGVRICLKHGGTLLEEKP